MRDWQIATLDTSVVGAALCLSGFLLSRAGRQWDLYWQNGRRRHAAAGWALLVLALLPQALWIFLLPKVAP